MNHLSTPATDTHRLTLNIKPEAAQSPRPSTPFNQWTYPDGSLWCALFREGEAYRMRFPGYADFIVHPSGVVDCIPIPGLDRITLQHMFQTQVTPVAMGQQHCPFFHASCVAIGHSAAAFLGDSGRGKSTLATYMALHGAALLTDDGLALEWVDGTCMATPNHPALRLWEDSRNALIPSDATPLPPISYTVKERFSSDGLLPFASQAVPLKRAYFLGDTPVDRIAITRLSMREAHIAWVRHSPMLDVHDRSRMISQFEQAAQLAKLNCSFTLDYPRSYAALPEVAEALRAHLSAPPP